MYIYASTENILRKAQCKLHSGGGKAVDVPIQKGEVIKITPTGEISRSAFAVRETEYFNSCAKAGFLTRYDYFHTAQANRAYIAQLKTVAQYCGFEPREIDDMIMEGFTLTEIEDMIYDTHYIGYCF